jgi:hypothetical protein
MAAARCWQQHWAAEGKVCSGDAGHLNPPPYAEIGKGEEHLAAPNQHSDRRDNLLLCAGGTFDPWRGGGVPRSASPAAQLQRRAFLPGVEVQLRLFVAPTPTRICCCHIASSGPTSTTTIYDNALVECMRREGEQDDTTTMTATMTMLLWGGGSVLWGLFARGGRISCGAVLQHLD